MYVFFFGKNVSLKPYIIVLAAEAKKQLGLGHGYLSYLDLKKSSMFGAGGYHGGYAAPPSVPFLPYGYHQGIMNFAMTGALAPLRRTNEDPLRLAAASADVRALTQPIIVSQTRSAL